LAIYNPFVQAIAASIPAADGLQETPPIWWHTFAGELNSESQSGFSGSRYQEATGEIVGAPDWLLQDTLIYGSYEDGSNRYNYPQAARKFDIASGSAKNTYVYGTFLAIQATSINFDFIEHSVANATGIRHCYVEMFLGSSQMYKTRSYQYLELAYGEPINYRIGLREHSPVTLEYKDPTLSDWKIVASARMRAEPSRHYSGAKYASSLMIHIMPDYSRGLMVVELDEGMFLRHAPPRKTTDSLQAFASLPAQERFRLSGSNPAGGYNPQLLIFQSRYPSVTVNKGKKYFGPERLRNIGAAQVIPNTLGTPTATQTNTSTVTQDGQGNVSISVTGSIPYVTDTIPREGGSAILGAETPPVFSDILVYIPSTWSSYPVGFPLPEALLSTVQMRELQVWDDASRMGMTTGRLLVNNRNNVYTGTFGNYAVSILAGNGNITAQRLRGVIGCDDQGIVVSRRDPFRFVEFPFHDFMAKLATVTLNQEITLDGLCIYTAIRLLLDLGQVDPSRYALNIPDTGFPTNGRYPANFPYYILGKGTGLNPKYRFMPERTVLSVLQELIQDSGDPFTGYPHFMWFDALGQFHWEAYNPGLLTPVRLYSDYDTSGVGAIYDIKVFNSVSQMRTEIILQGQDAITYELLQYYLPLPGNIGAVGFRFAALERNSRYASPAYMAYIANVMAQQASLPTQIVKMRVPYWPDLTAGQVIGISEGKALGRSGLFTVLEIDSTVGVANPEGGDGMQVCESWITARAIENSIKGPSPVPPIF
jgi:hypothetical protein